MFKWLFKKKEKEYDAICVSSSRRKIRPPHVSWKHSWAQAEAQNSLARSPFNRIPTEILLRIFQLLSVPDLCNVSLVCRLFKMVADQNDIWKLKCNTSTKLYSKSFKQTYMDWMYEKYLRNKELKRNLADMRHFSQLACVIRPSQSYLARLMATHPIDPARGFSQHPNSSSYMTITLSVDIHNTTHQLISLLEKVSKYQDKWYQSAILKQMITRYYRFMQLKAIYLPNVLLVPTLDIEIIWQTHLLRPEMYRADCLRLFRQVVDHSLLATDTQQFKKKQAFIETCHFYEERFGEKYCELPSNKHGRKSTSNHSYGEDELNNQSKNAYSYWDETFFEFSSNRPKQYENPFSFTEAEIILDGHWLDLCKKFMYDSLERVSIDDYYDRSRDFIDLVTGSMERLKKSYERFLYMSAKHPLKDSEDFVPPTYAIDIMWHAHMQEPLKYEADCLRLVGYVIPHSPWPIIEDEKMKKKSNRTDQMWQEEFQSEISTDHLYQRWASLSIFDLDHVESSQNSLDLTSKF
ncbi:unnamed protein product [Rotaria socialis]|uniref:F-box domain-containing protein n=1 Tax=Rotaria socialis TaxID=392032 RepID=A0A820WE23_9BILA|nr:unnamed protein product [Rotaria socialis]CAF3243531.1 unnamed protein product [Rotaria socialis]CAF3647673.1 unnamed protein product [Rotaria socialis]CAF3778247.1 unnamed protein product [Rotaria socialis]CAF4388982.1 unnamed protein product [Rotaria socialis]